MASLTAAQGEDGQPIDYDEAARWYVAAASLGNESALDYLAGQLHSASRLARMEDSSEPGIDYVFVSEQEVCATMSLAL